MPGSTKSLQSVPLSPWPFAMDLLAAAANLLDALDLEGEEVDQLAAAAMAFNATLPRADDEPTPLIRPFQPIMRGLEDQLLATGLRPEQRKIVGAMRHTRLCLADWLTA